MGISLNSGKDPFSFEIDSDNKNTAVVKPKKFFKSRNIPPVVEESRQEDATTLRKSVTDSNNTLIFHYDIVKTDCSLTYSSKSTIEPLIGRDQPLPTTTQELIDILSSDSDTRPAPAAVPTSTLTPTAAVPTAPAPVSTLAPLSVNTNTENNFETAELDNVTNQVQHCFVDISITEVATAKTAAIEQQPEQQHEPEVEPDPESEEPEPATAPRTSVDVMPEAAAKTLLDQDWFSGSDDSESAGGNAERDTDARNEQRGFGIAGCRSAVHELTDVGETGRQEGQYF